jgi:hypothetical protein
MKTAWKQILGLALVLVLAGVAPVLAQGKTFTGTITEIARGTELDVGRHANYFVLRLKEYPETEFRLAQDEAVRYGVVDPTGTSGLLTPKKCKGLGWKVKLSAKPAFTGWTSSNSYQVLSLQKLGG